MQGGQRRREPEALTIAAVVTTDTTDPSTPMWTIGLPNRPTEALGGLARMGPRAVRPGKACISSWSM